MKAPTTKLSLEYLRQLGYLAEVVEHWKRNPATGQSTKHDLFGIIDILALRDDETIGVQTTTKAMIPVHVRKIAASPIYPALCRAGWSVVVHGWHQPNGPRTRWQCDELTVGEPVDV